MARSFFAILGVSPDASPEQIRSAYRRLAKELHPDRSGEDSRPFRELQEAYEVLSDAHSRRAYEQSLRPKASVQQRSRRRCEPEPFRRRAESFGFSGFASAHPLAEILEELFERFSASRPARGWQVVVPLTRQQAARGGSVEVMAPARVLCPDCRGFGGYAFFACPRCAGEGALLTDMPLTFSFPAGLESEHAVAISLEGLGLPGLQLTVVFRPPRE